MKSKHPLDPRRLRKAPPRGFGWIDHRLLRDGYFERLSAEAVALYCLLVCAADQQGLSYYSDRRLCFLLGLDTVALGAARRELIQQQLMAYEEPLCQILCLEGFEAQPRPRPAGRRLASPAAPLSMATAKPAPEMLQPANGAPRISLREMLRASLEGRAI